MLIDEVHTVKQAQSPSRMKNIFKLAKLRFPVEFTAVTNSLNLETPST